MNYKELVNSVIEFLSPFWMWVWGLILSVVGYYADIRASFHVLWITALFHVIVGVIKSYTVKKQPFSIKKFFIAVFMCAFFTLFLMLVEANDRANHQHTVSTFRITTWILTGAYLWHIVIIGSTIIDRSPVFRLTRMGIKKVVKNKIGIDLPDKEEEIK